MRVGPGQVKTFICLGKRRSEGGSRGTQKGKNEAFTQEAFGWKQKRSAMAENKILVQRQR